MTRVTNFGRKRTFLEAGFTQGELEAPNSDATTSQPSNPDVNQDGAGYIEQGPSAPPPKKKRKRTPKSKRDGYAAQKAAEAEGPTESTGSILESSTQAAKSPTVALSKSAKKKQREKARKEKIVSATESRRLKRIQEKMMGVTCFACREKGHAAKDCPMGGKPDIDGGEGGKAANAVGICYRCGSKKHSLSRCKKPSNPADPYPYASCFVCNGKGHLASACPQNKAKGVYPNGGCCKLCGETSHLARDCTIRQKVTDPTAILGTGAEAGADEDDFHMFRRTTTELDRNEKQETKMKRMLEVKAGVHSGTVVTLGSAPLVKTKVVVFK